MEQKQRDYLFDNYKVLLIVLVVLGHFIEVGVEEIPFLYWLKWFIFSFHMPAFIFISGYFSKRQYKLTDLFRKLLVPYLIFEVLYYILYVFIIQKDTELYLLYPKFSLWYLMALFVWKWITPWVKKIPGHMILAVIAGLLAGASSLDDNFLTLPRMITFYPFFLLGVHFQREWLTRFRTKACRWGSAAIFVIINLFLVWVANDSPLSPKIFYGRYDYEYLDLTIPQGMAVRIGCYAVAVMMTLLLGVLLPQTRNSFSYLGTRTMAIYLFHGLVYSVFKCGQKYYGAMNDVAESIFLLAVSLLVVWLLSRKPFTDFTNFISNIHMREKE